MLRKVISKLIALTIVVATTTTTSVCAAKTYDVPSNNVFKSYMDYNKITDHTSAQWQLQLMCTTSENGLRMFKGRYCIAIGTGYDAPVGTYVDVKLTTGEILQCIIGDIKSDNDTESTHKQDKNNNSVVEFVVSESKMRAATNKSGTVSSLDHFAGEVESITRYTDEDLAQLGWNSAVTDFENTQTFLVTDKYTINTGDTTMYFIEYASATNYNTIEVDADTYSAKTVNYSVISIP